MHDILWSDRCCGWLQPMHPTPHEHNYKAKSQSSPQLAERPRKLQTRLRTFANTFIFLLVRANERVRKCFQPSLRITQAPAVQRSRSRRAPRVDDEFITSDSSADVMVSQSDWSSGALCSIPGAIIAIVLFSSTVHIIEPGHVGITVEMGTIGRDIRTPGVQLTAPWHRLITFSASAISWSRS